MKKILILTLVTILILSFTGIASAASVIIDRSSSSISNIGGQARISSYTDCNTTATRIRHYMILQRYNGSWQTYSSSTYNKYNTYDFTSTTYKSVASGYNYRLVTYHYAYDGEQVVDFKISTSSSVYIG